MQVVALVVSALGLVAAALTLLVVAAAPPRNVPLVAMAATLLTWQLVLVLDGSLVAALFANARSRAAPVPNAPNAATANRSSATSFSAADVVLRNDLDGTVVFVDGDLAFQAVCEVEAYFFNFISNSAFAANTCLALELFVTLAKINPRFSWWNDRRIRVGAYLFITFAIPCTFTGIEMIERPTKARYVLDSYCDYERYIYQFVVYEILWDVLFFFVGLFFLVHAIIAYYRKHRDLSGSSLSSSSAPSSAQEGPALPKSTIMQFILRMIVWCFGISVFSLVYFAASIFTAWTKYGDGGWYNTVGVQTDAASMSIFTPSVCSILMFACFGSTQRARLAYATLFGCCCVRNRKYPVSSDGGALTRQESGVALNTLPPPTNSNPQNPYALNSPVAILYPSTAPGGDVGPITTRFNSGDDDDFMLPRSPRSPTSPWATAPDRPPLGPGARVSPYPATSAAAAGIGRDGWSTSLDRERTSMGLVRKGSEKRDHVGRDPVVLQDVSAFTPGWKSPPTSYAVQPAPAAASAAYHPHGYSQPLPNAHSHIVAPPGGDRSKPIPF